jgi:hypothetical protein
MLINPAPIATHDGQPFSPVTHEADGVPRFGPMQAYLRAAVGTAHDAHLAELQADPNGWPDPETYKKLMKQARQEAIAQWLSK